MSMRIVLHNAFAGLDFNEIQRGINVGVIQYFLIYDAFKILRRRRSEDTKDVI